MHPETLGEWQTPCPAVLLSCSQHSTWVIHYLGEAQEKKMQTKFPFPPIQGDSSPSGWASCRGQDAKETPYPALRIPVSSGWLKLSVTFQNCPGPVSVMSPALTYLPKIFGEQHPIGASVLPLVHAEQALSSRNPFGWTLHDGCRNLFGALGLNAAARCSVREGKGEEGYHGPEYLLPMSFSP